MSKQHQTLPGEPEEVPVQPENPEIKKPGDPHEPRTPEEAPQQEPKEIPDQSSPQPETGPVKGDIDYNKTEV